MALSDRQFKRKVFDELKNTGTIDGIKGSLRSRLVGVLQRKDPSVFDGSGPSPGSQNLWQRAANSLYVEYLNHQNYGYALSVFQPECGLTDQQVMSRDEISRVLCLERPSSLSQHLLRPDVGARNADGAPAPPSPLLLNILQAIAEIGASSARRETPTQTDDISGGASSLALRLAQIDEQHERAVATERLAPLRDAEERMASFQKECESRMRAEMLEHVRRVREHEVTQARLEEASKHRRNLAEAREDLERVHSDRLQKLRAREEAQIERVRAAEAALERAAYEHRQRLAAEHDTLRGEKEAFQREQMGRAMLRAREEEAAARREAELNAKEMSWQSRDLHATEEAQRRAVAKTREAERDIEKRREELHAEIEAVRRERATLEKDKAAALSVVLSGGKGDAATDILVMQIEDLRVQLDKANAALAKRGEATMSPEAPQLMLDDGREKKNRKEVRQDGGGVAPRRGGRGDRARGGDPPESGDRTHRVREKGRAQGTRGSARDGGGVQSARGGGGETRRRRGETREGRVGPPSRARRNSCANSWTKRSRSASTRSSARTRFAPRRRSPG